jgi:TolB protein
MDEPTPVVAVSDKRIRRRLRIAVALTLVGAVVVLGALQRIGLINLQGVAASTARLAIVDAEGALVTMNDQGGSVVPYPVPGVAFQFPAWSLDGSRIAAIGQSPDGSGMIDVLTTRSAGPAETDPPIIYQSPDRLPFYLYWRPDGRSLTFLTTEPTGIALRIAPADGSHTDVIVRQGAPLYWDFADHDRLFVHIGTSGGDAFLGEIDPSGASKESTVLAPGIFRSPAVSKDYRYRAYVAPGNEAAGTLILEARDGPNKHTTPVYGAVAFGFDPSGTSLAFIAPKSASAQPITFPLGPLRILDPGTGAVRTLLDASEIAFFWAPDGKTIAALQVEVPGGGGLASANAVLAASESPAAPSPGFGLHLRFVDVASGAIRSERQVQLSDVFVTQLLPFFDQYALSHRIWSPDSASIALPLVGAGGVSQIFVIRADGSDFRRVADGTAAFWSP